MPCVPLSRRNDVIDAEFAEVARRPKPPLSRDIFTDAFNGVGVNPVTFRPSNKRPGSMVRALFIGINYEGQGVTLRGCHNDVLMCFEALQENNVPIEEACFLIDQPGFPHRTGQPTFDSIIQHFKWLVHGAKPGDQLFLHYSGHGTQHITLAFRDEPEVTRETIVPLDYKKKGIIDDGDIYKLVVAPLQPGLRMTAIFDCCHSGSLMNLPFQFDGTSKLAETEYFHPGLPVPDVLMIAACEDDATESDVSDVTDFGNRNKEGQGNAGGAATNAFVYTLNHRTNQSSYFNFINDMRSLLRMKGFKPIPQMSSSKPIDLNQPFSLLGGFTGIVGGGGGGGGGGAAIAAAGSALPAVPPSQGLDLHPIPDLSAPAESPFSSTTPQPPQALQQPFQHGGNLGSGQYSYQPPGPSHGSQNPFQQGGKQNNYSYTPPNTQSSYTYHPPAQSQGSQEPGQSSYTYHPPAQSQGSQEPGQPDGNGSSGVYDIHGVSMGIGIGMSEDQAPGLYAL